MTSSAPRALPDGLAAGLVFLASGAVLVLEIVGLRLVAPYVGVTLETSSAIIGFALAAIALGAWAGGRLADSADVRRLLGFLLVLGGALMMLVLPVIRYVGAVLPGSAAGAVLVLAALAVVGPAAVLSAVPPMVVTLQLATLARTGTVVGRMSSIGTLGAIAATFLTGFVLVALFASSTILLGTGAVLLVAGVALSIYLRQPGRAAVPVAVLLVGVLGVGLTVFAPQPCDLETRYHCARVDADPLRPSGQLLILDALRHSYVDAADPTYLEFDYIQAIASVADVQAPAGTPIGAVHIGGGGLTLPRYLAATRPGGSNLVLEVDPGVAALALSLEPGTGPGLDVRVTDGRVGLAEQPADSADLVVGDAFGGLAVPWHLTTREAVTDVARVLRPDGIYALNVIDYPPNHFARAEIATVLDVFAHVAVIATAGALDGTSGGNFVLVASTRPLPLEPLATRLAERGSALRIASGGAVEEFAGDAAVLTDELAPVDQLLTPYG
ncbi:hypothetical protein BH20ACT5_BH20ACT5_01300 [soil metagenome]